MIMVSDLLWRVAVRLRLSAGSTVRGARRGCQTPADRLRWGMGFLQQHWACLYLLAGGIVVFLLAALSLTQVQ